MNSIWAAITEFFTGNAGGVLALVMLAAIALVIGAFVLWRRTGEAKQPVLMVLLALIAVANVLIWTVPDGSGVAPIEQVPD
ncbi:hypothetical protein [Qipengyuania sp. ASV99]|uniref:hypothetical protein n=1 Tax=Qipengyuania sp. ASV99 TaxID=3399681 RepID=UPI003A4C575A